MSKDNMIGPWCAPGYHEFYFKEVPDTDEDIIAIVGCHRCSLEFKSTKNLSEADRQWAMDVAQRYLNNKEQK